MGIIEGFKSEKNMKIHVLAAIAAITMGSALHITKAEWLLITFAISLVISVELLNTAIEKTINNITKTNPETYKAMGLPKDLSAGAVLIVSIAALVAGLIIFLPYLI